MDELDLEILQRVGASPFLSWPHPPEQSSVAGLAKALQVSKETVRRRLADLERSGVLAGRVLVPNYRALGLNCCTVHFRARDVGRKSAAVPKIAGQAGVLAAFDMLGPDLCVDLCFVDEADRTAKVQAIERLLGSTSTSLFLDLPLPALAKALTPLDWRIVHALMQDAGRSHEEVAAELGVSGRTVKRRLTAMVASGAIDVVGNIDPGRLAGHFLVYLLVRLRRPAGRTDAQAVVRAFRRRWLAQWSPPERELADLVVVTVADSAGAADGLRREAMTIPAVANAEVLILSAAASQPAWLMEAVAHRASPPSDVRRVASPPTPRTRTRRRSR